MRRVEQLCQFGADGTDDESLTERGWRKRRRGGKHDRMAVRATVQESLFFSPFYSLFTVKNRLEKHNLRRVGLFQAHADYPLLFESQSVTRRRVF